MKNQIASIVIALSLSSAFAHAAEKRPVVNLPSTIESFPVPSEALIRIPLFKYLMPAYDELCEYDSRCRKVGSIYRGAVKLRRPSTEQMKYYKELRPLIIQIANQYGIDPVTLVSAPLAENTMNVNIDDKIQDEMEAQGMLDDEGRIINPALRLMITDKPMSIGPGQIYVSVAKKVEWLAARIENRPVRESKAIKEALKTRGGALRYAAAIIRDAQDTYAQGGVDISHRPDVLATLYNIGQIKKRLNDAKSRGGPSYANYFGYFVAVNYWLIQKELGLPSILGEPPP